MKTKLTDIIDSVMIDAQDPESYLHGVDRVQVIKHAMRSIEELRYVGDLQFREAEGTMNSVGKFRMPADFVDYIAIFFVVDGYLVPALMNPQINTWYSYMLENDDIVAAQNITASVNNTPLEDNRDYEIVKTDDLHGMLSKNCILKTRGNEFIVGKNGYKFDYRDNTLTFDDIPAGYDRILIRYIANVDFSKIENVEIHSYFQKFVEADIYWRIIEKRRSVPMNEKIRAKQEKIRRHKDAMFETTFKYREVIQALFGL